MATRAIVNARLVMTDRIIEDGVLLIQGERIAACGPLSEVAVPSDAELLDAAGAYVGPGFIDIHNHGGGGVWSHEQPLEFAETHMQFGTTGVLPTVAYMLNREDMREGVIQVVKAMEEPSDYPGLIVGIHLEGPFLNPKYGANRTNIRPVDLEECRDLLQLAGNHIKIWTMAPEMPDQDKFIEEASRYKHIVFSAGHSESDADTLYRFVPKGLRLACHCMDASGTTPAVSRFAGTREVGLDEAVLAHDEMTAEVIPDAAGVHVRPLMLKLILKAKGVDKVIIITDAMPDAGTGKANLPENFPFRDDFPNCDDLNFNINGGLEGSRLTMDRAVNNMMRHTGCDITSAFRMASLNPAKLLGMEQEMGSLQKGLLANLVIVDEDIQVQQVIFKGNLVPRRRG